MASYDVVGIICRAVFIGKQDAPDATLMKYGGACNTTASAFDTALAANEKRLRESKMSDGGGGAVQVASIKTRVESTPGFSA
jgi:hypothetical protein